MRSGFLCVWVLSLVTSVYPLSTENVKRTSKTSGQPLVALATGLVSGVSLPQFGQENFLGIPYALPPVGARRFSAPTALPPNASQIIQATDYGKACMQPIQVSRTRAVFEAEELMQL